MTRLLPSSILLLVLTACPSPPVDTAMGGDGLTIHDTNLPPWTDDSAELRFIHLAPDVAPDCSADFKACLDVYLNDAPVPAAGPFPFGGSTGFIDGFPSGDASLTLTDTGTANPAYQAAETLGAGTSATILLSGVDALGTVGHSVLAEDLGEPDAGLVRVRIHHLMYGLEALPLVITDHTGGAVATVISGSPEVVDVPPAAFDGDGDSVPDSHLWFVDLTPAGQPQAIPFLWHMDLDGDGVAEDATVLDLFILPVPDMLPPLPLGLIHSHETQVPGQFPPYTG